MPKKTLTKRRPRAAAQERRVVRSKDSLSDSHGHVLALRVHGISPIIMDSTDLLPRLAMKWAHVVRNRVRWARDPEALEKVREDAIRDLRDLGITEEHLQKLGAADLSELVHQGQKVCPLSLLCREGLLYFQGFARSRKPRTLGFPMLKNEI